MLRFHTSGVIWIIGLALALTSATAWAAPPLVFPEDRWHVALDPGHGGDDTGARGPTGLLEKNFCLSLARTLALRLETRHRVTLTRSDDYHVQLAQRAAIANETKANLFVSLHCGASFHNAARGAVIYYHAPSEKMAGRSVDERVAHTGPQPWREVQARHDSSSRALAKALRPYLEKLVDISEIRVIGAPLAPLAGVDMPAVLIEMGHITHPATEQRMATSQTAESLVRAIDSGINEYIRSQVPEQRP